MSISPQCRLEIMDSLRRGTVPRSAWTIRRGP